MVICHKKKRKKHNSKISIFTSKFSLNFVAKSDSQRRVYILSVKNKTEFRIQSSIEKTRKAQTEI